MNIAAKIIIGILAVIIVAGAVGAYSITKVSIEEGLLHVEEGTILVNEKQVEGMVKVREGDVIETKEGKGTIILYESLLVNLEPNTKITIEELTKKNPKIKQEEGKTWNQFTKLFGMEDYTISAGNTVASVRGTGYQFSENKTIVGEGTVEVAVSTIKYDVERRKVIEIINGEAIIRDPTQEELEIINSYIRKNIKELQELRAMEVEKHQSLINFYKRTYGVTDEEIAETLEQADLGEIDVDIVFQYQKKIPIPIGTIEKVVDITKAIQKLNKELEA